MNIGNPKRSLWSPALHSDILSQHKALSLPCFSCHSGVSDYNLEEIPGRFLPHTLRSLSLSLSFLSFFFSFLEAKYEMPDALATNLTQLKSKAHKNHCKLPHNTQSCHLGLKSKDFRKLHRCPQRRNTGSVISRYCPAKCSCFSHADLDGLLFPF